MSDRLFISGERVSGLDLLLGTNPISDVIRDGAEVVDSRIRIQRASNVTFYGARFIRCQLDFLRSTSEEQFYSNEFADCRFTGQFYSVTFGYDDGKKDIKGSLINCDFSTCDMHLVSFYNCDPETTKFPGWPHIVILYPDRNKEDWQSIPFPKTFESIKGTIGFCDPSCVVKIVNWNRYAKDKGCPAEMPNELRDVLKSKSYIRI